MSHKILGLHHATATVADAQDDLDFCLEALGLRLVKKTVNFDNHNVFHFYYGNERGTPGTIWTTFPYKGWGVPVGEKGAGQVVTTCFSAPAGSLALWKARLGQRGARVADGAARFGRETLAFRDLSGLDFELVACEDDDREAWRGTVGQEAAIRGLHSVTIAVNALGPTLAFMTGLLGFTIVDEMEGRTRVAAGGVRPGHIIDIVHDERAPLATNGLGTVHHVAVAIGTDEEQLAVRADLLARGFPVTEVRDRQYFKSIYFREPGNVLFEVATMQPGFLIDEELRDLGRDLKLPPWEEPYRREIEARLPQVTYV
ncbi:MAG: ring-cleaving dioxygenase [Acidobacteria bacterium]|nr:ring-cleaving dioxygenase [Acidobacteriota bacterium]